MEFKITSGPPTKQSRKPRHHAQPWARSLNSFSTNATQSSAGQASHIHSDHPFPTQKSTLKPSQPGSFARDLENKATKISNLVDKLQHLSVHTRLQRPLHFIPALENLDRSLDDTFRDLGHGQIMDQVLLKHKRVAPNQCAGWNQTAEVMGAKIKSKHPPKHNDPYSAKEASGKRAQPDARQPLKGQKITENTTSTPGLTGSTGPPWPITALD